MSAFIAGAQRNQGTLFPETLVAPVARREANRRASLPRLPPRKAACPKNPGQRNGLHVVCQMRTSTFRTRADASIRDVGPLACGARRRFRAIAFLESAHRATQSTISRS